jgi:hypothetical protein
MIRSDAGAAVVVEKLREFDRVATILDMPHAERLGILNVSDETYCSLRSGTIQYGQYVKPELVRRLTYALPLMRRLASNTKTIRGAGSRSGAGIQVS